MQEEVESRSVNLAITTTKVTAKTFIKVICWYLRHRKQKRVQKQMKKQTKQRSVEGKQSVGNLMKSGVSTDKIELPDGSAKDFCKVAKKYGVDFAIRKDKTMDPPRYVVFFKAKDTGVLDQVVKEYTAKTMTKQEKQSVRKQLREEKAKARQESKEKAKKKTKKIKKRKERVTGR